MIGDALTQALPELRAEAESMMRDTCVISGSAGDPVWNDTTGEYEILAGTVVYSGPCRVRMPKAAPSLSNSGDTGWSVDDAILSLPVAGSEGVGAGMSAVVALGNDPANSLALSVMSGHWQTDSTARRLPCKVVSRDA